MNTATISRTDALSKVRELQQEAADLEIKHNEKMDAIMGQIAQVASLNQTNDSKSASLIQNDSPPARRGRPPASENQNDSPPARRGRPPASENQNDSPPARRRGRPPASEAAKAVNGPVAKNSKISPDQRNYSNEMSLKQAIWDVLDRPAEWPKLVSDLPEDAVGLQFSEIKDIIEHEKKWVSSSPDISTMVSSHLHNLKKEGLLGRTEQARYYIIEGAELIPGKRGRKAA